MTSNSPKTDLPLISSHSQEHKQQAESHINIMEKRLSDKFEEFSAKRASSKIPLGARDRPTEILEVNEISPILHLIEERINKFEKSYGKQSGFFLGLICAAILAFACIASEVYMPKLPTIEVLFVAFLVAFLFNYYLIRDGEILPYIEIESDNFLAKVSGISGFISIILFIYSFQKCELQTTLFSFGSSWIFYIIFEQCSKKSKLNGLNKNQIIFGFLMIAACAVILRPNFIPEYEITQQSNDTTQNNTDEDASQNVIQDDNHMYGVISGLVSGIFFGYMNMCIRQLKNYNFITITHIFTYIQAPFIPVFFPLQKLVSPSLAQWVFMISLGLIFVFVLQLYIRSCQLENTTKSLLTIPQFIAFISIFSILLGVTTFGTFDVIKIVSAIIILGLSYKFALEIKKEIPIVPISSSNNAQNNQDIPLQTFSDNNANLQQKLLDDQ